MGIFEMCQAGQATAVGRRPTAELLACGPVRTKRTADPGLEIWAMSTASYLQGELLKRGHFIPSWRRRVFTLRHDYLSGYTLSYCTPGTVRVRGAIKISLGTTVRQLSSVSNGFVVETAGQPEYALIASSPEERQQWMDAIETAKCASIVESGRGTEMGTSGSPTSGVAELGGSTIRCTVIEARNMTISQRSEVYVHIAVGSYVRRTKIGMLSALGDKTIFCESLSLPFQRSNLFAVVDIADQEQRGRVLGRGIVPLLHVDVHPRRVVLPLAAISRGGSAAGAAGCSTMSACTGTLVLDLSTDIPVQDGWQASFRGVRTLSAFYRPLLPPVHPDRHESDNSQLELPEIAENGGSRSLDPASAVQSRASTLGRRAAVLANPLLADTLELPLHPVVRRQVIVQRAVAIGCIQRDAAPSLAHGTLDAVCDWPPCGSERVEAAAMVLLRPFADARAGLFPGTLFLTNFRLVWIAASHVIPDLSELELQEMLAPPGHSASDSTTGSSRPKWSGYVPETAEAAPLDDAASTTAAAAYPATPDQSSAGHEMAGGDAVDAGIDALKTQPAPLWDSSNCRRMDEASGSAEGDESSEEERLRVVVDQDVDSSDSPGSLSFSIPLRMLVGVTASNSTVVRDAVAAVPAMHLIYKSIKRDEALAAVALSPVAPAPAPPRLATATATSTATVSQSSCPEPPAISPAAVAAITGTSPHQLLRLPETKPGSKRGATGGSTPKRHQSLAGRLRSFLTGKRAEPPAATTRGNLQRPSFALEGSDDDLAVVAFENDEEDDAESQVDDVTRILTQMQPTAQDDDGGESLPSDSGYESATRSSSGGESVVGGVVIVDDWALEPHDRSPVGDGTARAGKPIPPLSPDHTLSETAPAPQPPVLPAPTSHVSRRPSSVLSSLVGAFARGYPARSSSREHPLSAASTAAEAPGKPIGVPGVPEAPEPLLQRAQSDRTPSATPESLRCNNLGTVPPSPPTSEVPSSALHPSFDALAPASKPSMAQRAALAGHRPAEEGQRSNGQSSVLLPGRIRFGADGATSLAALPDMTSSASTVGDSELVDADADVEHDALNPFTAAKVSPGDADAGGEFEEEGERQRARTVHTVTLARRRALDRPASAVQQQSTVLLGGGVLHDDFFGGLSAIGGALVPSNGATPAALDPPSSSEHTLAEFDSSACRDRRSLTQVAALARTSSSPRGIRAAAMAVNAFAKPTRRRQGRMSMAITPAAMALTSFHGPSAGDVGAPRMPIKPPPPPRRTQTAPSPRRAAAGVEHEDSGLESAAGAEGSVAAGEKLDATEPRTTDILSPLALEQRRSSCIHGPAQPKAADDAVEAVGAPAQPAAATTKASATEAGRTPFRHVTRGRAGAAAAATSTPASSQTPSPRDSEEESDDKRLLGSLCLGTNASSTEADLPVLAIATSDARAPRFIVIGAGVFPSHEAMDATGCDADKTPAQHVCEALRTRIAYVIAAARDEEALFVDQSAPLVEPALAGSSASAGDSAGSTPDGTSTMPRATRLLLTSAYARLAAAWGARTSLADACLADFRRQGVSARHWRVCRLNHEFQLCASYPPALVVPAIADDAVVRGCAQFRTRGRIPALTWYHPANGAAVMRSSQPKTGAMGQRSRDDEHFLDLVRHASPCPASDLAILDCRPLLSAQANMLKGGGFEAAGQGGYITCTLQFCGIGNIHSVRKALAALVLGVGKPSAAIVPNMRALQDRHWQRDAARTVVADYTSADTAKPTIAGGPSPRRRHWTAELAARIASATSLGAIGPASAAAAAAGSSSAAAAGSTGMPGAGKPSAAFASASGGASLLDDVGRRHMVSKGGAESGWLELASSVLAAAVRCVRLVDALGITVLVHCSDGWDRTSQVCSLAKLLMDPYFRTIEGFAVLVRTDWLHFGHKFQERMGRLEVGSDEASPVFFQWLDCVFQVHRQFPERFEFTEAFLEELVVQSQAGWGGSFLFDTEHQRHLAGLPQKSLPEFAMLQASAARYRNAQYIRPPPECLGPVSLPDTTHAAASAGETGRKLRRWNRSLVLIPDFSEQAMHVWPLFQRFDRAVYKAIERTQGAAVPTLSMINSESGGLLL